MIKNLPANAGDTGSILGLGRSPGEGHGNPLQYSCWRIPWTEEPGRLYSPRGHKEMDTTEQLTHTGSMKAGVYLFHSKEKLVCSSREMGSQLTS